VGGITIAWLAGEAIIIYRHVSKEHRPPMPGQLLGSSGFFALAAVLAEYAPARPAATLLAWGIVIAAYLQVPIVAGGSSTPAAPAAKAAPAAAGGKA
jgi:hypothetical protein